MPTRPPISDELRAAYDAMPLPVAVYAATGEFVFLNEAARRDISAGRPGFDPDELLGTSFRDLPAEVDPAFERAFEVVAAGPVGAAERFHFVSATTGGGYEGRIRRAADGFLHATLSRTSRRDAALLAVQHLIEDFPFGACYVFDPDLRYLAAYGRGVSSEGRTSMSVVGRRFDDVWDREVVSQLEVPYRRALEGHEADFLVVSAGRVFRNWISGVRGADGRVNAGVALVWEVTSEVAVQDTLDLVRRSIDALPLGVTLATATAGTPIIYANRGFSDLTGHEPSGVVGEDFRVVLGPESDPEAAGRIDRAVREGRPVQEVLVAHRADGSTFWNRLTISPIRIEGEEVTHFIGVHEDVSEHRRTGEELQMSRRLGALGQLAGGLAHDMRNVLTGTGLIIDLLAERSDLPNDVAADLREVHGVLGRGASITDRLLSFAREHTFERGPIELNAFVRNRLELVRTLLRESVDVRAVEADAPAWILGNEGQLDQALLNLAKNAEGAMPEGGHLELRVRTGIATADLGDDAPVADEGGRRWAVISVHDDGAGMPPEIAARAFEPFFTTRKTTGGTGLGLASVYGVVTGLGGVCWIESTEGVGTEVQLAFPEVEEPEPADAATERSAGRFDGVRVLIAEDDTAIRGACARFLESRGATVEAVADGATGRALITGETSWDVLVTDAVMPTLSGPELIRHARAHHPEIACLLISGYTDVTDAQLPGNVALLEKPFSMAQLSDSLDRLVDRHATEGRGG